jgi:hypothetical protein
LCTLWLYVRCRHQGRRKQANLYIYLLRRKVKKKKKTTWTSSVGRPGRQFLDKDFKEKINGGFSKTNGHTEYIGDVGLDRSYNTGLVSFLLAAKINVDAVRWASQDTRVMVLGRLLRRRASCELRHPREPPPAGGVGQAAPPHRTRRVLSKRQSSACAPMGDGTGARCCRFRLHLWRSGVRQPL